MEKTYVTSSNIDQLGYNQGSLFIQFKSGTSYRYDEAPYHVYQTLVKAESVGSAFHRFVKGRYRYTRLDTDPFKLLGQETSCKYHSEEIRGASTSPP